MSLEFLNKLKKENKEIRREQNKRYRQKNRQILNLKKQRIYYQMSLEKNKQKYNQIKIISIIYEQLNY